MIKFKGRESFSLLQMILGIGEHSQSILNDVRRHFSHVIENI